MTKDPRDHQNTFALALFVLGASLALLASPAEPSPARVPVDTYECMDQRTLSQWVTYMEATLIAYTEKSLTFEMNGSIHTYILSFTQGGEIVWCISPGQEA